MTPFVSYHQGMFSNEPLRDHPLMAAAEFEATCHHEAAHAVLDYAFGNSLASVGISANYEIDADGEMTVGYGGEVRTCGPGPARIDFNYRRRHYKLGVVYAAGPAGERAFAMSAACLCDCLGHPRVIIVRLTRLQRYLSSEGAIVSPIKGWSGTMPRRSSPTSRSGTQCPMSPRSYGMKGWQISRWIPTHPASTGPSSTPKSSTRFAGAPDSSAAC